MKTHGKDIPINIMSGERTVPYIIPKELSMNSITIAKIAKEKNSIFISSPYTKIFFYLYLFIQILNHNRLNEKDRARNQDLYGRPYYQKPCPDSFSAP